MRALAVLVVVALAGCSHAHIHAQASTSGAGLAPPSGDRVTGGGIGIRVESHSLAALVIAGMFLAAAAEYSREPRPMPSFSSLADWFRGAPPAAEPAPGRKVLEHDCTRPLPETSGNLKCR